MFGLGIRGSEGVEGQHNEWQYYIMPLLLDFCVESENACVCVD